MTLQSLPNLLSVYDFAPSDTPLQPRPANIVPRKMYAGIIIVTDNSRPHLEKCLTSLLHTVGLDSEVIVVDNASTDGSAEFIEGQFPWVTLIRNASNEGPAAYKRGVAESTGRYVVLLDSACEVTPGWLDLLLKPLEPDEHGVAPAVVTVPRVISQEASSDAATFPPPCFALARKLWDTLGGVSEGVFSYSQEVELAGYPYVYVPEALVYYKISAEEQVAPESETAATTPTEATVYMEQGYSMTGCVELEFMADEAPAPVTTLLAQPVGTVRKHVPKARVARTRKAVSPATSPYAAIILLCALALLQVVAWGVALGRRQVK